MSTVSVILPTYARNAGGMLRNAIESVLAQDMPDLELLVVDDGSKDGSADTIRSIVEADPRVRHIRFESNVGLPALTTAEAFRQSRGQYIAWQFDDCTWQPNHLSTLLGVFAQNPSTGVTYGQVAINTIEGERVFGEPFDADNLAQGNMIPNCSTLIRREVYETVGWIDPSVILKRLNDYDMWVRASKAYSLSFTPTVVARENGQALTDSLGNSVSLAATLASKYMATDRNEYLKVVNMDAWRPYSPPQWVNADEAEQFAFLAYEHFMRVGKMAEGAKQVIEALPDHFGVAGESDLSRVLAVVPWYFMRLQNAARIRKKEVDDYLQEQLRYIDGQHQHIQNQASEIEERDRIITDLQRQLQQATIVVPAPSFLQRLSRILKARRA